jgi:hypothetical protein
MKKISAFVISALMAASVFAGMDDRDFSFSQLGAATSTVSYVLRGELEGVHIDVAPVTTQMITVTTAQQILYSNATVTADAWLPLRYAMVDSSGTSLINTTNNVYEKAALAGSVSVLVLGKNGATTTNATTVKVIYKQ